MQGNEFDIHVFHSKKIVLLGDFMVDEYLQGEVSRISPEAPVPVVNVTKKQERLGGAGNVVLNLTALGAKVAVITYLGQDRGGDLIINRLKRTGVNVSGILQGPDAVTSIKTRVTAQNQQLLRYDQETVRNVPEIFSVFIKEHIDKLLDDADAVIISDYG